HRSQVVGHPHLVETARDLGQAQQGLDLGRKNKSPPRQRVIIERLDAKVIAGTEQRLLASVPKREGKVAQELLRAAVPPLFVRRQDQLAIRDLSDRAAAAAKGRQQFLPVVDPSVGGEGQVPTAVP